MSLQTLIISVLVTCITVGATFFYFRNRIQRTEQKVDLMFSLIQEHENNAKLRQQFQPAAVMQAGMSNNIPQEQFQNVQTSENELINISDDDQADDDDDSEYDSDDSAEVSDNDDDDKLTIDEDSAEENLEDTVKTISLSLDGAETTASEVKIADIQNLEEHTVDENKQDIINKVFDQLEQVNNTTSESLEITEINDDLDEINLSDVDDEDPDEEDQTDATTMEQDGNEVTNYSKLTAKKLKELAKEKGLEAKGLKKKELIVLLSSSE
jgi:hypothetical protein